MPRYKNHSARVAPAPQPLPNDVQQAIDIIMRGNPPLALFTTMARDRRLFFKFFNSGLLDRGHLTIRQREIVIDRVTATCGAEYEWGVHVSAFAAKAGLTEDQITSLTTGAPEDACWDDADRVLIRLCDSLHRTCTIDDDLWAQLSAYHSDEAILELLMLAGTYRMVSYLVNSLRLPLGKRGPHFSCRVILIRWAAMTTTSWSFLEEPDELPWRTKDLPRSNSRRTVWGRSARRRNSDTATSRRTFVQPATALR